MGIRGWAFAAAAVLGIGGCGPYQVVYGPRSCQIAESDTTPLDGEVRGKIFYFDGNFRGAGLVEYQDGTQFQALWAQDGVFDAAIVPGTEVEIATADRRVVRIPVGEVSEPRASALGTEFYTQWITKSPITSEQVRTLAESAPVFARTRASTFDLAIAFDEDVQARLQTLAICLVGPGGPTAPDEDG